MESPCETIATLLAFVLSLAPLLSKQRLQSRSLQSLSYLVRTGVWLLWGITREDSNVVARSLVEGVVTACANKVGRAGTCYA